MYRGQTQTDYQNKHYNIKKNEETQDDRGRDGGTNFILRIKEQETRLTLQEHHDDDDDYDDDDDDYDDDEKNRHEVHKMASYQSMFKENVRRKCYNSSEKAGLLHISTFSASFSFVLFFLRRFYFENFVTKIKGSFRVNLESIPREKNFDFGLSH